MPPHSKIITLEGTSQEMNESASQHDTNVAHQEEEEQPIILDIMAMLRSLSYLPRGVLVTSLAEASMALN
ncbi:hypothetical protein L484_008071 [Morus notabilis]|uniref:Uncharacterized protein n=1 Tax=Morus notabilis TaxID=981085 RepID=W9R343_9ROSA|nr:hypothetical protein L484_008071 [Morus notabilis]